MQNQQAFAKPTLSLNHHFQWMRKFLHISNGCLGFSLYTFVWPERGVLIFLSTIILISSAFDLLRMRFQRWGHHVSYKMRLFFRQHEATSFSSNTKGLAGIFTALLLFPEPVDYMVMMVTALGDPVGAIVGRYFGKHHYFNHKSIEGSSGIVIVTAIAALLILKTLIPVELTWPVSIAIAFYVGLVAAFTEALPIPIDDNITIPVLSAPLIYILFKIIGIC